MQCPEIWNVGQPTCNETLTKFEPDAKHHFNHSVSVSVPDTSSPPDSLLASIFDDSDYYRVHDLRAHQLVNNVFIEAFVKQGNVSLLSINRYQDVDSTITVTPCGHLILSLTKRDHDRLGLEGIPMKHKLLSRFVVKVNLNEESFTPGKKYYQRVRRCLEEALTDTFDVIVCWEPPEEKICPSSIAAWFDKRGCKVSVCQQQYYHRPSNNIQFPRLDQLNNGTNPDPETSLLDFFNWYGYFTTGCDLSLKSWPRMEKQKGSVQYIQCTGFLTSGKLTNIIKTVQQYVKTRKDLPWCCIEIHGFVDCPTGANIRDNAFFTPTSENAILILHPNSNDIFVRRIQPTVRLKSRK